MNQILKKRIESKSFLRIGNKKINFSLLTTVVGLIFNSTVVAQSPPVPPLPPSPSNDPSKAPNQLILPTNGGSKNSQPNNVPNQPALPTNSNAKDSQTNKVPNTLKFQNPPKGVQTQPQPAISSPHIQEKQKDAAANSETSKDKNKKSAPVDEIPHGKELVNIDFPNGANLSDIIKTIGLWTGRNFVLAQGVAGSSRISIISPEPVTKEEAYQAFLSALNISGFTTVETGSVVKILPIANAKSSNIKTYYGENWSPSTDEIINQVVPLKYIEANSVINQLRPLLGITQYAAFTTTNSLILTDTGNRIRRILEVIKLLDSKTNQPLVSIVPINYMDAKDAVAKVNDIFGNRNGPSLSLQKVLTDERTNSIILVGPANGLDDIVRFIQRIDKPAVDQNSQTMVRVRPLDYADAEKLAQTLQALTQNTRNQNTPFRPAYFQPPPPPGGTNSGAQSQSQAVADLNGVKVTADKATNSLVIQGSKSAYDELDGIIAQLDKRRAQVYVEASIVDMAVENDFNWKPSTLGGATLGDGRYVMPFGFNAAQAAPFVVQQTNTTTNIDALKGAGNNFMLGILSNKSINLGPFTLTPGALLFALKQDSNANILQTPSMMVSDNETANFQSNQQYSNVTNTSNPNGQGTIQSVNKYDVTTSLKITPQISRTDFVSMKINLQLDDAGPVKPDSAFPNPISKRSAESTLIVQNSQTAVLGGITQDSHKIIEAKVPLLGDIPILGWLFKTISKEKRKTSLTLFVTPHIVRNSEDLEKIYTEKIKDRDLFLKAFYGDKFKEEDFYSKLPNEEAGKAPVALPKTEEQIESEKNQSFEPAPTTKRNSLPSEDPNPINAPSSNSGVSGGGFGFPSSPPPPPPPYQ